MTHQWGQVPTVPEPPQWRQAPPSRPPPKRSSTAKTITIMVASFVGLSLFAAALVALRDLDYGPGAAVSLPVNIRGTGVGEQPAAAVPAPNYPEPKLSDFKLEVKELRRQKFGPAGANITTTSPPAVNRPMTPTRPTRLSTRFAAASTVPCGTTW
jgi:hypothetical protein